MIAVDTSALIAILQSDEHAAGIAEVLARTESTFISAGTLVEALIVAQGRGVGARLVELIEKPRIEVVDVDAELAHVAGLGHATFGRGNHSAQLNFGDCFAYALAKERDLPLLYVGEDFARTDVLSALLAGSSPRCFRFSFRGRFFVLAVGKWL